MTHCFKYLIALNLVWFLMACQNQTSTQNQDEAYKFNQLKTLADSFGTINFKLQDSISNVLVKHAEESKIDSLIIKSYLKKTDALIDLQLFDEAQTLNKKNIELCSLKNDLGSLMTCKYNLGLIYLQTYQSKEAIDVFNELKPYYIHTKDYKKLINGTANIGWAHYYNLQYINAIKYTKEAIQIAEQFKVSNQKGDLFQRLGVLFAELNQIDSSDFYFSLSNNEFIENNNYIGLAYNVNNIGGMNYHAQRFDKAISDFKIALKLFDSLGMGNEIGNVYNNLGISYKDNGNYQLAEQHLKLALIEIEKFPNNSLKAGIYKNLAVLYSATKDFQQSTLYYKKHIDAYSEFTNENNQKILEELNIKYENAKKEKLISELNNQKLEADKKFNLTLSLILLLLIVIGFSLLLYFQKRKKNEILKSIENQKLEIEKIKLAEENERQRIGKNLHDNMGAYATSIIAGVDKLLEIENYDLQIIENIKSNAANVLINLRENITILNNKEISFMETLDQFKNYTIKILQNYEHIDYEFIDNISNDFKLNAVKVVHLQSMLNEIFHNAIKHSQCKSIKFNFKEENGKYSISVLDDGIGFDKETLVLGNGIKNLQWRAEQLNAHFTMNSDDIGCEFKVVL